MSVIVGGTRKHRWREAFWDSKGFGTSWGSTSSVKHLAQLAERMSVEHDVDGSNPLMYKAKVFPPRMIEVSQSPGLSGQLGQEEARKASPVHGPVVQASG